ncbi:MAG TPA: hypothetical protein VNK82_13930 [Terriglobales bacterium]|nr:hypothetical protein [Terriglobales bacterium]
MPHGFDLEKYLRNTRKVDVSDLDWAAVPEHPLSAEERRCLTYMMDIESHTIVYLKGILNTCAIRDPETTAFLNCWAYEEFFHGHTIRRFLEAAGARFSPTRAAEVQGKASFYEWLKDLGASLACQLTDHFHAAYLTYGAISELTTLEGYGVVARRTRHPVLRALVLRLAKDERRHFSFYYNKAREQLAARNAQRLTSWVIRNFWLPVGGGVKPETEVDWMMHYVLGDEAGHTVAARIDSTIARLPGLEWFDRISRSRADVLRQLGAAQALPALA